MPRGKRIRCYGSPGQEQWVIRQHPDTGGRTLDGSTGETILSPSWFGGAAMARGVVNTYKFEVEHVAGEPLLRIFPVGDELFFEFVGSNEPLGQSVMKLLEEGFETDPPSTFSTVADRSRGTWYRFA